MQETICMQCGNEGFNNAFIYCVKCLEYAVHRYCLDVIPESLDEFVRWICDDCQMENLVHFPEKPCEPFNGTLEGLKKKNTTVSPKPNWEELYQEIVVGKPDNVTERLDIENQCAETMTEERTTSQGNDLVLNPGLEFRKDLSKDARVQSMMGFHSCAEPIITPIWRGSFDMYGETQKILSGLKGHISSKACEKVYKETNLLQSVLRLEMLPQSDVWPKNFKNSKPCDENIALFFFPSETSEQAYKELVDSMRDKELALRGVVQNAEILVFTSSVLPLIYYRFKMKCYLWGVFRVKPKLTSQSD